jgi:hypothetical protein
MQGFFMCDKNNFNVFFNENICFLAKSKTMKYLKQCSVLTVDIDLKKMSRSRYPHSKLAVETAIDHLYVFTDFVIIYRSKL